MLKLKKPLGVVTLLLLLVILTVSFIQPAAPANGCDKQLRSEAGGTSSHFFGLVCTDCHSKYAGKAPGCFTLNGSVYDEARTRVHPNPVIQLFTEPGGKGELVATIPGDQLGNFYTTDTIDYRDGLYPTLVGTPGSAEPVKHMYRRVFTGECSKCHGKNVEALGID
jgi:hypothetical protein